MATKRKDNRLRIFDALNVIKTSVADVATKSDVAKLTEGVVTHKEFERYKRDWSWNRILGELLEGKSSKGIKFRDMVARRLVKEAIKGNMYATKLIMDRMDGMPSQDITTKGLPLGATQYEDLTDAQLKAEIEKYEEKIARRLSPHPALQESEEGEVVK